MPYEVCTNPWEWAVAPFNIMGDLYYVGNRCVSSHLIDTGEGLILIDTAFPQTLYLLLESIRRLGFNPDDIAYVLHTHAHYDHMGGTKALVELTHAKTVMGKEDVEMIRDRPELTWTQEYGMTFYEDFDVDIAVSDGDVISLGSASIRCVHSPGHTPGCMSFLFDVAENGQTYRAGLMGGPGLNTLSDEYLARYGLSADCRTAYLDTFGRLKKEHVDIQLGAHPGQSRTFDKQAAKTPGANPFVNEAHWPAFIEGFEATAKTRFSLP
jgi:metallo-beta-lactamase class B